MNHHTNRGETQIRDWMGSLFPDSMQAPTDCVVTSLGRPLLLRAFTLAVTDPLALWSNFTETEISALYVATYSGEGLLQKVATSPNCADAVAATRKLLAQYGHRGIPMDASNMTCLSALGKRPFIFGLPYSCIHPVSVAAEHNLELVRFYIEEFGVDPTTPSFTGHTPLLAAIAAHREDVVAYLASRVPVAAENPVWTMMSTTSGAAMVALHNNPRMVPLLKLTSAEVNAYYRIDARYAVSHSAPMPRMSLLVIALFSGKARLDTDEQIAAMVEAFVVAGADPNQPGKFFRLQTDAEPYTPLRVAIQLRMPRCVEVLLLHGADPNLSLGARRSPLYLAGKSQLAESIRLVAVAGGRGGPQPGAPALYHTVRAAEYRDIVYDICRVDDAELAKWLSIERQSLQTLASARVFSRPFLQTWLRWSPVTHHTFPAQVRRAIKTMVFALRRGLDRRKLDPLPLELVLLVCSFVDRV